jgi:UDP-N-acetylglucosamine/UDP-N-acetylgalactosamine diphosphorylase
MTDAFALADRLRAAGQDHLLTGIQELTPDQRTAFLDRLAAVDWQELADPLVPPPLGVLKSSRVVDPAERSARASALTASGEAAYRAGRTAVLMVAGGQGTRFGSSAPKGCFQVAKHSGKSIYQLQAEKVLSLSRRVGRAVPFLVMTSPATDAETREFFAVNGDFGLAPGQVRFFSQGTVPSLAADGEGLLAAPGKLLENPDGHGGCFTALVASGQLARLRAEGVAWIVYIQVDNILAPVDDAILVGLGEQESAEVVTKVLAKAHPDEKVGHLVRVDGRDHIIEYTEVTPEQTRAVGADGQVILRWGSPAMLLWSVGFLGRLADAGYRPPLHRSAKPLKAWRDGQTVELKGWKSERFIFDMVTEAEASIGLAIDRSVEFAPVKNASGDDSPASAVAIASVMYADWLRAAGVRVDLPPGATIEISPLFAATRDQFLARWDHRTAAVTGDFYLEDDRPIA